MVISICSRSCCSSSTSSAGAGCCRCSAVGLWALVVGGGRRRLPGVRRSSFRVNADESSKEAPYIKRNIAATRAAMNINLSNKNVKDFAYDDKNLNAQSPRRQLRDHPQRAPAGTRRSCSSPISGCRAYVPSTSSTTSTSTVTTLDDRKTQVLIVGARAQHGGRHVELVGEPASAVHARIRRRPVARPTPSPPRAIRN